MPEPALTLNRLRRHCLTLPGARAEFPFGPDVLVFKVAGRIFALAFLESALLEINLKCDPLRAEQLRACYAAIRPGYHMNKRHWNTVTVDGSIPREVLLSLIDDSYRLVLTGLSRKIRVELTSKEGATP
jgi:predicted DNA-binding protein (MmcQ/YjbR family)